jgi:hypothetical protein
MGAVAAIEVITTGRDGVLGVGLLVTTRAPVIILVTLFHPFLLVEIGE